LAQQGLEQNFKVGYHDGSKQAEVVVPSLDDQEHDWPKI
jgi:hypothetical protein